MSMRVQSETRASVVEPAGLARGARTRPLGLGNVRALTLGDSGLTRAARPDRAAAYGFQVQSSSMSNDDSSEDAVMSNIASRSANTMARCSCSVTSLYTRQSMA